MIKVKHIFYRKYLIIPHLEIDTEKRNLLKKMDDIVQHTKRVKDLLDDTANFSVGKLFVTIEETRYSVI